MCVWVSICSYRYVFVWGCACAAMGMCLYVVVHCSHRYAFYVGLHGQLWVCVCMWVCIAAMGMHLCVGVHTQLWVCACVQVCIRSYENMFVCWYMCKSVWRKGVNLTCWFSGTIHFIFESASLPGTWGSLIWLGWQAVSFKDLLVFLLSAGISHIQHQV